MAGASTKGCTGRSSKYYSTTTVYITAAATTTTHWVNKLLARFGALKNDALAMNRPGISLPFSFKFDLELWRTCAWLITFDVFKWCYGSYFILWSTFLRSQETIKSKNERWNCSIYDSGNLLFGGFSRPTKAPKVLILIFTALYLNLTYFFCFTIPRNQK